MGCFLGCFGFSSKRKRRKPPTRVQTGDHVLGSYYEPLGSAAANLETTELSSKKPKAALNSKIRKKVSFNLNVQSYEPIPKEESPSLSWESDGKEKKEHTSKETAKEEESVAEKMASYPSNYRYRNCIDSYDEEDEIAYDDESEFDDDDVGGGGSSSSGEDIDDELRIEQVEEFADKFKSLSLSSQKRDSFAEEKSENVKPFRDGGLNLLANNRNAQDRSQYVHSVLNPVENLSQWKAVKIKGMPPPPVKRQRKENVALEQQEIAVDASLSNWLVSAGSLNTKSGIPIDTIMASNKNPVDTTFPWKSREDMPVLDIINLEA